MPRHPSEFKKTEQFYNTSLRRAQVAMKKLSREVQQRQQSIGATDISETHTNPPHLVRSLLHFAAYRGATLFFYSLLEPFWTAQIANAYRYVTAGKTFMRSADIQSARRTLKAGDIIAARNEAAATTNFIEWLGSRWTHVGVYLGDGKVLEALDNAGVVETSLPKYMRRYTRVAIYRPIGDWDTKKALAFGKEQIGKNYNFAFLFNDKSFYCSQLTYRVFLAGGFKLARPRSNRVGYPILSPDEFIFDNREHLELVWSVGHEIFHDQAEAIAGISRMTAEMILSVLAESGIPLGEFTQPQNIIPLRASQKSSASAIREQPEDSPEPLPRVS